MSSPSSWQVRFGTISAQDPVHESMGSSKDRLLRALRKDRWQRVWLGHLLLFLGVSVGVAQGPASGPELSQSFTHPPDDCRIMVRWWWFGPAVTGSEIRQELEQMKAAGIGGVEIATLYPLALDDPQTGFRNLGFLSDDHIDALRFAAVEAH